MFCVFMIFPVLGKTAVWFSVCAEYFLLIKQATALIVKDRNVDRCIISNIFKTVTLIMARLADFRIRKSKRTISQPESHRSVAIRLPRVDTRSPRAKFSVCLAYLKDRRLACCASAAQRYEVLNHTLFFHLRLQLVSFSLTTLFM